MVEIVIPESLDSPSQIDDRLSLAREMAGRRVFSFDGPLDDALSLTETLSETAPNAPVLTNHVTEQTDDHQLVDVYMYRDGRKMSVSEGVKKPASS